MPDTKVGPAHVALLLVFPSGKSITDNVRLALSYEWASNPTRRNHHFIGLYTDKTIKYVGKAETITVASYQDGEVHYREKGEAERLKDDHRRRIERVFEETVVYNLKDGLARRFYLVDTFCWAGAIKTSSGPMRSTRYFELDDFELSKAAYRPAKDIKDYTSEEMAQTLRGAIWSTRLML